MNNDPQVLAVLVLLYDHLLYPINIQVQLA